MLKLEKGVKGFFLLPVMEGPAEAKTFKVHKEGKLRGQIAKEFTKGEVVEVLKDGSIRVKAEGQTVPWLCRITEGEYQTPEQLAALKKAEKAAQDLEQLKAEIPAWTAKELHDEAKRRTLEVPEKATPKQLAALILDDIAKTGK